MKVWISNTGAGAPFYVMHFVKPTFDPDMDRYIGGDSDKYWEKRGELTKLCRRAGIKMPRGKMDLVDFNLYAVKRT